ncbi:hypothetical protein Arub01_35120 [Actinomadura rubrobrunea]|uniref:Uncharacterized protein n=1 Tax=Actinomadura rubrobrunea TaxID=115335 RepID=A0A9W6UWP9_9ACTN|nr:hypothetical protein Arub01_35120 [Actinomadura rubrobrunea]
MDMIFTGLPGLPVPGTELVTDGLGSVPGGVADIAVAMSRLDLRVGSDGPVLRRHVRGVPVAHPVRAGGPAHAASGSGRAGPATLELRTSRRTYAAHAPSSVNVLRYGCLLWAAGVARIGSGMRAPVFI